jgi:hypothetical protein
VTVLVLSLVVVAVMVVVLFNDEEGWLEIGRVETMLLVTLTVTNSSTVEEVTQLQDVVTVSQTVGTPLLATGSAVTSLSAMVEVLHGIVLVT